MLKCCRTALGLSMTYLELPRIHLVKCEALYFHTRQLSAQSWELLNLVSHGL